MPGPSTPALPTPTSGRLGAAPALVALLGLAGVGAVTALAPEALGPLAVALAAALAGAVAVLALRLTPTGGFVVVVVLSLAAQGNDEGADALEVVFGVSLLAYLAAWYGTTLLGGRRFVRNGADVALGLYLLGGAVVGTGLSVVLGNYSVDLRSDLTCLLALALYFPAREVCVRSPRGVEIVAGLLLLLGVFAAGTNAARLLGALSGATELYEVVDVRVSSGEVPMIAALLCALAWLTTAPSRRGRLALLFVVVATLGGLVLAKSRGPWVTAAVGVVVAFALLVPGARRRLVTSLALGGALAVGAGVLVLGSDLFLIGIGLLRRLASISGAATADISLLNRYVESAAAWAAIKGNPVLGYGWGAPVTRFDLLTLTTTRWSFLHNGYLWVWHKVGLWGLALLVAGYAGVVGQGVQAARRGLDRTGRALAAAGVGALVAFSILALPSNPFVVSDQVLVVGLVLGLVSGVHERERALPPAP